jgi:hypothetical protein
MDPTNRPAEEPLDRAIRGAFGAAPEAAASAECFEADILASWVDGGLSAADRAAVEHHASLCARCRSLLALVIQSAPAPAQSNSWGRHVRDWRLLVPLTAGAAAIVLWVAIPNGPTQTPAASPARAPESAETFQGRRTEQYRTLPDTKAPEVAREERATGAPAPNARSLETADSMAVAEKAERSDRVDSLAAAAPPPAANESVTLLRQADGGSTVVSPDPSIRWTLGASGAIKFSTDAGATWEPLSVDVSEDLTAGASPSPTVCWVVGRAGSILKTVDGRRFQKMAFPERVDLTAISATDATTAVVTTADKRSFRTTDGGRTWLPAPLQES